MDERSSPVRIDSIDGRSVVETAVVSFGTTALFFLATIAALAATAVAEDPWIALGAALLVWTITIGAGIVGVRLVCGRLGNGLGHPDSLAGVSHR